MSESLDESKRNRRIAKRILAIGLPLVLIAGAGIGYAYWTSNGAGSGTATASSGIAVNVTVGPATGLAPGGNLVVPVKLSNPSATNLTVSSLGLTSVTPDAAHAACDSTVSGLTTSVTNPGAAAVPAGAVNQAYGSVTLSMANTAANQDACKGVIYTVSVTIA